MKSLSRQLVLLLMAACCFSACEKLSLPSDEGAETDGKDALSLLQISTRAAGEGATVSYPLWVYVFGGEECVAVQQVTDASQPLSIRLVEGDYVVYAVGGASASDYVLPTQAEATPDMPIALQAGKEHGDLMVAQSSVTLADGQTNAVTLTMERRVMLLQSVVLQKIPSAATAVTVTLSPLYEQLNGTEYAGESGTSTVQLVKQSDGRTWSFEGTRYLLPPSASPLTITVNVTKPDGASNYTYSTTEPLTAGSKLNIRGTYTEAAEVVLTASIVGAEWTSEKTISFDFDESGSSTADNAGGESGGNETGEGSGSETVLTGTVPAVGDTYRDCYVVAVSEANGTAEVLLLSPTQQTMTAITDGMTADDVMPLVEAALPSCAVEGISGWRLMTKEEAQKLAARYQDYSKLNIAGGSSHRFLINNDGVLKAATMGTASVTTVSSFSSANILRPVATVRITAE